MIENTANRKTKMCQFYETTKELEGELSREGATMAGQLYRGLEDKRGTREDGNRKRTRESRVHLTDPRLRTGNRR